MEGPRGKGHPNSPSYKGISPTGQGRAPWPDRLMTVPPLNTVIVAKFQHEFCRGQTGKPQHSPGPEAAMYTTILSTTPLPRTTSAGDKRHWFHMPVCLHHPRGQAPNPAPGLQRLPSGCCSVGRWSCFPELFLGPRGLPIFCTHFPLGLPPTREVP